MNKNELLSYENKIIRVLEINESDNKVLLVDCIKQTMPFWADISSVSDYKHITDNQLYEATNFSPVDIGLLNTASKNTMYRRFTIISGILAVISDRKQRNIMITQMSEFYKISKQTIRHYLILYLIYQNKTALLPKQNIKLKELSQDEKNMRWALNKFFYNKNKNSLRTAYILLVKEKYCDEYGNLLSEYPTFYQFRYFYRKHKKMSTFYISRTGLKNYQKNKRPLLGNTIKQFANHIGIGMLDSTICDIYLVNDNGDLVGRPILTACVDAYSSLCCGYSLSWEGGMYSLRDLLLNVITDKTEHCKKYGILIDKKDWNCNQLPATFVTDRGSEYCSYNFEQITELGVKIINLPSYRPELKGSVEKFFDVIQNYFKSCLKGKGVIEPDYQQRGSHDYRKDACLTMADFEKIIIRCIVYYNSQRIIANYPYTEKMIAAEIQPYANSIFEWGKSQDGANLLSVDKETLILTLLPRTIGRFCRNGLKVNKLRYKNDNYTEKYLSGGEVMVAYNPDDVSFIWLVEDGYIRFRLIESRFNGKKLSDVELLNKAQKSLVQAAERANTQAQIDLASHILTIAQNAVKHDDISVKCIRETRQRERNKIHIDYMKAGVDND